MNIYSLYAWVAFLNIAMMIFLLTDLPFGRWFSKRSRSHDGHVLGLILMCWSVCCLLLGIVMLFAGWNSPEDLEYFIAKSKNPELVPKNIMSFARISMGFMIFTNLIPFVLGREIRSGLKML